eukprot:TRINITY_DN13623_c0_g1_i1.p1 TRINITY_DN13623_c0_g1~~TRINITY_DN13623_c0_g1_i1.p1  ORF type:complete len:149 (+),score=29.68 TRINITY_DN13623_c0_g1_i1:138-584(+)
MALNQVKKAPEVLYLKFDNRYGLVMMAAAALALECYIHAPIVVRFRLRVFNKKFMQENFGEEHSKELKTALPDAGFPDMGNGRYSAKLSYKDWFQFNVAQRVHQNFLEAIGIIIPATLIAGVKFPVYAAAIGGIHFLGTTWALSWSFN